MGEERIGHYEVRERLGQGGFGKVYRGYDTRLERDVAIKILRPEHASNPESLARFRREAKVMASLQHPGIVHIYDIVEDGDGLALVMEYVKGEPLSAYLDREAPLPVTRVVNLILDIAGALCVAHEAGILHRDIKPSNVIIDTKGSARLTDFGLARLLDESSGERLTGEHIALGTPTYMAPEQCQGQAATPKSDVYALGIMLYEMVTGRPPFAGNTPTSLFHQHMSAVPEPVRVLSPAVPDDLGSLVMDSLAKDSGRRPDASQVRERLKHIDSRISAAQFEETHITPDMTATKGIQGRRTKSLRWLGLAVLTTVLSGLAVHQVLNRLTLGEDDHGGDEVTTAAAGKSSAQRLRLAVLPFENTTPETELDYLERGLCETVTSEMSKSTQFDVVERSQVDRVLGELEFEQSKWIDPATAQEIGRVLGVDCVIIGSFQVQGGTMQINARQVDTTTGKVLEAKSILGTRADIFKLQREAGKSLRALIEGALRGPSAPAVVKEEGDI